MNPPPPPTYMTVVQYAAHRQVSERTVWYWLAENVNFPVIRQSKRIVRIKVDVADAWIDAGNLAPRKRKTYAKRSNPIQQMARVA